MMYPYTTLWDDTKIPHSEICFWSNEDSPRCGDRFTESVARIFRLAEN